MRRKVLSLKTWINAGQCGNDEEIGEGFVQSLHLARERLSAIKGDWISLRARVEKRVASRELERGADCRHAQRVR